MSINGSSTVKLFAETWVTFPYVTRFPYIVTSASIRRVPVVGARMVESTSVLPVVTMGKYPTDKSLTCKEFAKSVLVVRAFMVTSVRFNVVVTVAPLLAIFSRDIFDNFEPSP